MYRRIKLADNETIQDMLYLMEDDDKYEPAKVTRQNKQTDDRVTDRLTWVHRKLFPDFVNALEKAVNDGSKANQIDLLRYRVGSFFVRHKDNYSRQYDRLWSTVTLLDKSDDLEGGDLIIYKDDQDTVGDRIELEVGETIIFDSLETIHEVTKVKSGVRKSCVIWLG